MEAKVVVVMLEVARASARETKGERGQTMEHLSMGECEPGARNRSGSPLTTHTLRLKSTRRTGKWRPEKEALVRRLSGVHAGRDAP